MILWINGAFGSGKTSIAKRLNEMIENSFIFDPEETGFYLRENLPREIVESDFQDIKLWRQINFKVLLELAKNYSGTVIVPMTLIEPLYFDEIIGRLKEESVEIRHFFLEASCQTLRERLLGRGEEVNAWAFHQIERCSIASKNDLLEECISTENSSVEEIAKVIYEKAF